MHHDDAFRLIGYGSEDHKQRELVWNSTVGPAPKMIALRDGTRGVRLNWIPAPRLPQHRPSLGDLVLVEIDEDFAAQDAAEVAARRWSVDLGCNQDEFEADVRRNHEINMEYGHLHAVVVSEDFARERGWLLNTA